MKVQNMTSSRGNKVPNQFIVEGPDGTYFQSYDSMIAFIPHVGQTVLDREYWDYSVTTSKYRNAFLNEDTRSIKKKIASGEYLLADLNN